jgi:hypothetical protein
MPIDPMSLTTGAASLMSTTTSRGAKLAQGATDKTLETVQGTTGTLKKSAQSLGGPLGPALGALPLDTALGTVRGVTHTAFLSVRATLFALRTWLVSLWMLRWVRLIVQWTPAVIATLWIGAQVLARIKKPQRGRRC